MPDHSSDDIWDEYDWERFLQEQERRTEKYMDLMEKYLDHPDRDEIIAREMGWSHLVDGEHRDWEEEVDAQFEVELAREEEEEQDEEEGRDYEANPLYRQGVALDAELDAIFDPLPDRTKEHSATVLLRSQASLATAKLAAAMSDDGMEELGMCIAYLKRALAALTSGIDACVQLRTEGLVDDGTHGRILNGIFGLRDGIVSAMGAFREELRRRRSR